MAKFQFKILTGTDPQAQYDAIIIKDALTFYLLNTGIGYLGTVKLFDATEDGTAITNLVTDMTAEGYTGDDTSTASTKAIVDYVTAKVGSVSAVLTTSFFRKVEAHTLTDNDLTNIAISLPEGATVGEVGLLFTADTEGKDDGDEKYYFVSLKNYLSTVYGAENSSSINMKLTVDNKFKATLNVKADEESLKVDEGNGGVYIEKATVINDGDGTAEGGEAPSAVKLVTEEALVNYIINSVLPAVDTAIANALTEVVTYAVDDGTSPKA